MTQKWLLGIALVLLSLITTVPAEGQTWRRINPLQTECDDVRRLLSVEKCEYPSSRYVFDGFVVNITFSKTYKTLRFKKRKVTYVMVHFTKMPKLSEFEPGFQDYEISPDDDIPNGKSLRNSRKGLSISVQNIDSRNAELGSYFVTGVILTPPKDVVK